MRIGMVGPFGLHPNKTMESRALGLARPLVANGHQVRMFMPPWQTPAEADKTWEVAGVELRYVSLQGGIVGITQRLVRELLAWQPDIVHCFKPKAYSGLVAWWLWQWKRHRLPLVMDTDDWEGWGGWNELAPYPPLQKHFFAWQEQWGMQHCHRLSVASRALESLAWGLGVTPEQVVYVPNGAGISEQWTENSEQLTVTSQEIQEQLAERPTLLLYSRLFEFDTGRLVKILRGVQTAVPDLAILSVGAGLYEDDATTFREQLGELKTAVVDVGWVDLTQLPSLLRCAKVGIYLMEDTLLNRTKCPVKLADMIAMGLPVVGEAVGQVGEYVQNGRSGLLYASGDVDGVVAGLVQLLQQPNKQEQFGTAAQHHYQANFRWAKLAKRLETCYEELL